jgi:hypothetical protein
MLEFIEREVEKLGKTLGLEADIAKVLDYLEQNPELLVYENIHKAVSSSKIAQMTMGFILRFIAKRGGLSYEDVVMMVKECDYTDDQALLHFVLAYPNIAKALIDYLNTTAKLLFGETKI